MPYHGKDHNDYVNGAGFCCEGKDKKLQTYGGGIGKGNEEYEKMQYYYHADHLGSSSYITNLDAQIVQHVEYVPFGEVFIEERNQSWNTPYLFNGKELDEETGLYYYGARYYNPRESVWLSTDPLSGYNPVMEVEHYIDGEHNGGVFNSFNLNTYGYCYQNPILYVDTNGKQSKFLRYLEYFNEPCTALRIIKTYRKDIVRTAQKYNISPQAIASIIFQVKTAGIRGAILNVAAKNIKADKTTSLGLGQIQVQKAIELDNKFYPRVNLDINNQNHINIIMDVLEDPKSNIEYIAMNIVDMQEYVGRDLSIQEITFGHNEGKEALKKKLDKGEDTKNRVSGRSLNYQKAIKDALDGKTFIDIRKEDENRN
ncbi:RHS repeat domain-containing protein [Apibacter adventoris]|uniref:RHS repeat domain-containing protein n=1 Tax=Apibacter adventoris TaxID=1679466 RepID=UPI00269CBEB1|nr:RHS repeat-associated core domain-containing protein [Apibacter adventoris]